MRTEFVIKTVLNAADTLLTESDLSPRNRKINDALTLLVGTLSESYHSGEERVILNDPRIKAIRPKMLEKLAIAEGEMEKYWADRFNARPQLDLKGLRDFWYWQNYEDLAGGEIKQMPKLSLADGESIAFVGSGALPLTAIILHEKTGLPVTCVDNDPKACDDARKLVKKLGLEDNIRIVEADGRTHDYADNPVVFVASLVPQKEAVIDRIRETSGRTAHIAVRSAERLHTLLYEPVDEELLELSGCDYRARTPHDPKTINTTVFFTADPAPAPAHLAQPDARSRHLHLAEDCPHCAGYGASDNRKFKP